MRIPFCASRRCLYFSAPITNLDPGHVVRRTVRALARELHRSGYNILDDHVFLETVSEIWMNVAQRLGTVVGELLTQPHLMTDYDADLIEDARCTWWLGDCTLKSDGVGAESQVVYERLQRHPEFGALILIHDEVFEARAGSPFIARFRRFGDRCPIISYHDAGGALAAVSTFVSETLKLLPMQCV